MADETKPAPAPAQPAQQASAPAKGTSSVSERKTSDAGTNDAANGGNNGNDNDAVETDEAGKPSNFVGLPDGDGGERGIMHFDGSVEKVREDGTRVMSSYIDFDNGERLASKVDEENRQAAEDERAQQKEDAAATK